MTTDEGDQKFLDQVFDLALKHSSEGRRLAADEYLAGREELRSQVEEVLALARDIAVQRPPVVPTVPRYEILAELGRGAMGAVYLARQRGLERVVALKVLPPAAMLSPRAHDRFLSEARALARLRHPHIVSVFDVVADDDACAYAMEWVDGKTLAQAIDHLARLAHEPSLVDLHRYLDPARSPADGTLVVFFCQLGIQIARALEAVHHAQLLHRDLKPSNILLRKDGTALLSDFGLVRETLGPTHTASGEFLGTPAYAAPEQLRGDRQALDARTDVYALGVTLYHALALRLPYQGRSSAELLSAIERGHHPPLRRVRSAVSKDLDTIVATATDPDPRRRYESAAALGDDLERLLALRPITARPLSLLARTFKLGRRHARILSVAAVTAIVVMALAIPLIRDQERRRQSEADRVRELPQVVASEIRKARLALLSSDYGDRAFASAAGVDSAIRPLADETVQAALHHYDAAIALDPTHDDLRCERDVVVLSCAIHAGAARSPIPALARVAPLTCETARAWTDVSRPPAVADQSLRDATLIDRRYLGLLAYLCSAAELCPRAWAPFDTQLADSDPLVAGALGELYLQTDRAPLAYARLMRAASAFPEAGFLAVDLADAANQVGDHVSARAYLEQGRAAGGLDRYDTDLHIEADILAAEGNTAAARLLYEWMVKHHQAPTAHYHYALFLEREGDWQRVVEIYEKLLRACPGVEAYRLAFARACRAALAHLGLRDRIAFAMAMLEVDPKLRANLLAIEESPTVSRSSSSSVRDEASRWSFAFTLEVMTMSQDVLWRLPRPLKQLLAGAAVVLDACGTRLGRRTPMFARGLRLSVERATLAVAMLFTPSLFAQPSGNETLLFSFEGAVADDGLGYCVAGVGDVNRDGYDDVAISSIWDDTQGSNAGAVAIRSGRDDSVLVTWYGDQADSSFGVCVRNVGDVNADGYDDIAVGAHGVGPNSVRVFSGRYLFNGQGLQVLCTWTKAGGNGFGYALDGAGDVNADGYADVVVGAYSTSSYAGKAYVYSGKDCSEIWSKPGSAADFFGVSVAGLADVNGDGYDDFLLGAAFADATGKTDNGTVQLFAGGGPLLGTLIKPLSGDNSSDIFGYVLSTVGDVTGDGVPDFVVGAPGQADGGSTAGYARVFSGSDQSVWKTLTGDNVGDYFGGFSVAGMGDVDGDGVPDVGVAASHDDDSGFNNSGSALVYAGNDWHVIYEFQGRATHDHVGAINGAGDVNADGFDDVIVGVTGADPGGRVDAGAAYVFSGKPCRATWSHYGSGWPGTNGVPTITPSANPVICTSITLDVTNSLGASTVGLMFLGFAPASLSTNLDGTILVAPPWYLFLLPVPAAGLPLPAPIPCDSTLCGLHLHLQVLEVDGGASKGISFTPGLDLMLGGTQWP